ncbi:MAG: glycosyltransferase family 2 protein [Candidatus Shapirobacteria bacterium]|jgi:GT2 family glycosyltransferase
MDNPKKTTPPDLFKVIKENEKLLTKIISLKYKKQDRQKELSIIVNSRAYKIWRLFIKLRKYLLLIPAQLLFRLPISVFYTAIFTLIFIFSKFVSIFQVFTGKKLTLTTRETILDGISFIIPTWNKKNMVLKCLSLLDQIATAERSELPVEIIVVENGSIDGTFDALNKLKTKNRLLVLKQSTNLGYAKAVNLAVQTAQYNYVYLLNNDMEPQKNFLSELIKLTRKLIDKNKLFFGIASQIFFYDKTKRREESGKTFFHMHNGFLDVAHVINKYNLEDISIIAYAGGGSSLINKHLLVKLGLLDHKTYTPLYCEDMDIGYLAWKYGYPSYFLPSSQIIHHHQSSSKNLSRDPRYYMYKNFVAFILKNTMSSKLFFKYLTVFMFRINLSEDAYNYATENLLNVFNIFKSRVKSNKYLSVFSDNKLFDFVKFETKYGSRFL